MASNREQDMMQMQQDAVRRVMEMQRQAQAGCTRKKSRPQPSRTPLPSHSHLPTGSHPHRNRSRNLPPENPGCWKAFFPIPAWTKNSFCCWD